MYLIKYDKYKFPFLVCVILLISILDILGLGLIAPYIAILTEQDGFYLLAFKNFLAKFDIYMNYFQTILFISIALILVFFLKAIGNIFLNLILLQFVHRKEIKLRFELIKSYYNSKYELMISNNSSDSIENIVNLVPQFLFYSLYPILRIISNTIIFIFISVFLFYSVGEITLFIIFFLCSIIFMYDRFFGTKITSYGKKSSQSNKSIIKGVQETLSGLKEIKILDKEKFFTKQILLGAIEYAKNKIKLTIISTSFAYIFEFLVILFLALFVVFYLINIGRDFLAILPMLGILGLAILRLIPKAVMISADIAKIRAGRYATEQVYNVHKRLTKDESSLNIGSISEEKFTNLRLENIFYKYPGTEKYVISDINLEINKGEHIGIQGVSGSGKTTLVDLIIGHLNPNLGEIYFNGKQLNENNYPSFLSNISYIPQKIFLIDDTLKTNIALCDNDEIDLEKLGDSINKANLSELVSSLEHGVESKVGEDGINLSGGQRQRIALARSFYHNKNFIIFDEATSALDNVTADKVVKEIANLKENTVIMISHNRSSMKYCNKIYTIKDNYLRKI
tara:strand:+ start:3697 stop:5397 length:1701 start_codon:yes stop_codon:yes gene_type:complete